MSNSNIKNTRNVAIVCYTSLPQAGAIAPVYALASPLKLLVRGGKF
jgi:hypothetical protein